MPLFRFVLKEGAQARDTASLRLSDETAALALAERLALAVSRRRPRPDSDRVLVVTDGADPVVQVAVPVSLRRADQQPTEATAEPGTRRIKHR